MSALPRALITATVGMLLLAPWALAEDPPMPVGALLEEIKRAEGAQPPIPARPPSREGSSPKAVDRLVVLDDLSRSERAYAGPALRQGPAACRRGLALRLEGGGALSEDPEGPLGIETGATDQITWDAVDFDLGLAVRGAAAWVTPRWRLELEGTHYARTTGTDRRVGVFGFSPPPGSSAGPTPARLQSKADLWSGHLTWWHSIRRSPCVEWGTGLGLRASYFREVSTAGGMTIPGAAPGFVEADVEHRFLGGEVGLYASWRRSERFTLRGQVLALLGTVNRDLSVTDRSIFTPGDHRATREDDAFAFGVNLGVRATWRFSNRLSLVASYDLLVLDGIVRGHAAMDFTQAATGAVQVRRDTSALTTHALFLGLEFEL